MDDALTSRAPDALSLAQGWNRDLEKAPRDRVFLLKDPEDGQVYAAKATNYPGWRYIIFDPQPEAKPPGETWGEKVTDYLDGWNDRMIRGLLWRELPQ